MFSAINIGLSGMQAYSKGLQVISNNVTNLNTAGFKASSTTFADLFNQNSAGLTFTGGSGQGDGVRIGASQINFTQGTLQASSGDLDLAIDGRGMLVLLDGDQVYYTRTGQFYVAEDGYVTLQGTQMRLGVLDADGRARPLDLSSKRNSLPAQTTAVTFTDNLSSGSTSTAHTVPDIKVFDASGQAHTWQVKLTADAANPGTWDVEVLEGGVSIGTSSLKFNGSIIDPTTAKFTVSTTPTGGDPMSVQLDFSAVTSFSTGSTSTLRTGTIDGAGVGALTSVTLDSAGQIKLTYSNAKTELQGAVAIADFLDPQQLDRVGQGLYQDAKGSAHRLLASGQEGLGKLVSKQIEGSNVDLSQEFGQLILIQRGFQASSQIVSVANDMIQQLFGIRGQG